MDSKLEQYRAKKRREATLETIKKKIFNMVPFLNPDATTSKNDHVPTVEQIDEKPIRQHQLPRKASHTPAPPIHDSSSEDEANTVLPFTDSEDESIPKPKTSDKPRSRFDYFMFLVYFLFWVTCWAIMIQLKFGLVFLLFSGIFGVYFNTRTGPKSKKEVSAYSVFNKNCHSIDGTLKAEQFEREIRYGPVSVR